MLIETGKGRVNIMIVMAIWSLSLAVDLPGLAVSPILDRMEQIFPGASELEVQLLTVLPNVFIIPFVLLSGKLSLSKHKISIVVWALIVYLAAAGLYMIASSMRELIVFSCLLGVGCGLLIPFSTGLIADVFTGKYRMTQMGNISAIGNLTVVVATFAVGYLVAVNWHLPFLVYFIPVIPLLLSPWLRKIPKPDLHKDIKATPIEHKKPPKPVERVWPARPDEKIVNGFYVGRAVWLYAAYFFFMYASLTPPMYVSFLLGPGESSQASWITASFFLAMTIVGFALNPILRVVRRGSFIVSFVCLIVGYALFCVSKNAAVLIAAYGIMGLGSGMAQPIFFDKATECVAHEKKATLSLAFLMACNYAAISLAPEIVSGFELLFHTSSPVFPFRLNLVATALVFITCLARPNGFVYGIKPQYYE